LGASPVMATWVPNGCRANQLFAGVEQRNDDAVMRDELLEEFVEGDINAFGIDRLGEPSGRGEQHLGEVGSGSQSCIGHDRDRSSGFKLLFANHRSLSTLS
jgi:hypothetical protein